MNDLEKIIESTITENFHKNLRIIITSKINNFFPQSVIQISLKISLEPLKGLERQINELFVYNENFNLRKNSLVFNLSLYHSVLQVK